MKLSLEEAKEELLSQVVYSRELPNYSLGGQHCGLKPVITIGKHEILGIEIKCTYHKSDHKNKDIIENAMRNIINELIK